MASREQHWLGLRWLVNMQGLHLTGLGVWLAADKGHSNTGTDTYSFVVFLVLAVRRRARSGCRYIIRSTSGR